MLGKAFRWESSMKFKLIAKMIRSSLFWRLATAARWCLLGSRNFKQQTSRIMQVPRLLPPDSSTFSIKKQTQASHVPAISTKV